MTTHTASSPYSRAIIHRKICLNSLQAQRVMSRSFEKLRQSLFSLSVILPILSKDEDEIEAIDTYITEQFGTVETDLAQAVGQLKKVLEDNGIEETAHYSQPETYELVLDTPKTTTFLRLVADLDELMLLIDTAWLLGEFDDKQKKNATFMWQQRLIKLAGRLINIEKRARAAASKSGKTEEVEEKAPTDTTETDPELAAAAADDEAAIDLPMVATG